MKHRCSTLARAWLLLFITMAVSQGGSEAQSDDEAAGTHFDASKGMTVAQLTELIETLNGKRDEEAATDIGNLQLTERLSSPKLSALNSELPGAKSRAALMGVCDASVFLEPPKGEIPNRTVPDLAEQRRIMSQTLDYLKKINPKLPDFYARRLTTSFEEVWTPKGQKGTDKQGALHVAGTYRATVYYRKGKEVVSEQGPQEYGLVTRGTFGPILNTVILDAAHSGTTQWSRWEAGPSGPIAVFGFQVTKEQSHYEASFWAAPPLGGVDAMTATAYHGEIGIDPDSGTIVRLVLQADPDLGSPMQRADIMVEYGPVAIGGKAYTCPVRSVAIAAGESVALGMSSGLSRQQDVIRLDDVVFANYHVFRTEMRILPD